MASGQAIALWNVYRHLDVESTGVNIKASGGELAGWFIANQASTFRYVRFYDKATTPLSTDTPLLTLAMPPTSAANFLSEAGINFVNGLGIRATSGVADNDTTANTTNDVIVNVFYK